MHPGLVVKQWGPYPIQQSTYLRTSTAMIVTRLYSCNNKRPQVHYRTAAFFNWEGARIFPQFLVTFLVITHEQGVLRCISGRKSPTVLSKHHIMSLVRMFQTYTTCVYKPIFAEFRGRQFAPHAPVRSPPLKYALVEDQETVHFLHFQQRHVC